MVETTSQEDAINNPCEEYYRTWCIAHNTYNLFPINMQRTRDCAWSMGPFLDSCANHFKTLDPSMRGLRALRPGEKKVKKLAWIKMQRHQMVHQTVGET